MTIHNRITDALAYLGKTLENAARKPVSDHADDGPVPSYAEDAVMQAFRANPWFIPDFILHAYGVWSEALREENIRLWLNRYETWQDAQGRAPRTIGLIMAGNIPMVGLHDLICVLASGNNALIKLSGTDEFLIPAMVKTLADFDPAIAERIAFADGPLRNFDAIIATGSNNSSRYFEYYFGRFPHIIRKNRNSAAVITGNEKQEELEGLAEDIFLYFGLGCRNVSKIYYPLGYDLMQLFPYFEKFRFFADHHKYRNNYDYQKSILMVNSIPHLDNGFLILKEAPSFISPVSAVNTQAYQSTDQVFTELSLHADSLQCIISSRLPEGTGLAPGKSQHTRLTDYADGIDTMEFLLNL